MNLFTNQKKITDLEKKNMATKGERLGGAGGGDKL